MRVAFQAPIALQGYRILANGETWEVDLWWELVEDIVAARDRFYLSTPEGRVAVDCSSPSKKHGAIVRLHDFLTRDVREQDQRDRLFMGKFEHPVHFFVIEKSLRAGQNRVIVGHDHAAGLFFFEESAVDCSDARNQSIGGCPGHEILFGTSAALRRHRQRSVFHKTSGVAQILNICPGCSLIFLSAFFHRLGSVLIQTKFLPCKHFGKFRPHGCRFGLLCIEGDAGLFSFFPVWRCRHARSAPWVAPTCSMSKFIQQL